jgi:mono/diheme cytochrome c family protein
MRPAAIVVLGTALATACGASNAPPSDTPRPPEQVYRETCGYCHGANVGPVIRGRQLPPAAVRPIVRQGSNAMPAFRPTEISDSELDALAVWLEASEADPQEQGQ